MPWRLPGPNRAVPQAARAAARPPWGWSLMGWEFRRSAPSDNVMVPATADPFESPKWAPPVWHMPPALVLLVNLVRGLVGLVLVLARHWPTTVTVAGLGWLTYLGGWQLLALLAG